MVLVQFLLGWQCLFAQGLDAQKEIQGLTQMIGTLVEVKGGPRQFVTEQDNVLIVRPGEPLLMTSLDWTNDLYGIYYRAHAFRVVRKCESCPIELGEKGLVLAGIDRNPLFNFMPVLPRREVYLQKSPRKLELSLR